MAELMDLGPDIAPRAVVADKGYDSRANRALARNVGRFRSSRIAQTPNIFRRSSPRRSIAAAPELSRL